MRLKSTQQTISERFVQNGIEIPNTNQSKCSIIFALATSSQSIPIRLKIQREDWS